jgi:hypothetical protein
MRFGQKEGHPRRMMLGHRREQGSCSWNSKPEFQLACGMAWGLTPQANTPAERTEDLDEFCDHFGRKPKTTGRTFTG